MKLLLEHACLVGEGVGVGVTTGFGVGDTTGVAATTRRVIIKLLAWYSFVSSVETTTVQFPTFLNSTTYKGIREQLFATPIAKR
jgi:hypothetical protein